MFVFLSFDKLFVMNRSILERIYGCDKSKWSLLRESLYEWLVLRFKFFDSV